ncbi:MAG: NAD(P)-dependent oxidoreductase [Hyphomicrobiales bacterium]|nr:NAD(P)-dependent oxidoreductase [Hyphomicrobiales bacterium]
MKVLVTGGTGFIGAAVVRNLLARGIPVVIGEHKPDQTVLAQLRGAEVEPMDVADAPAVEAAFARHPDLSHCIHLAYLMSAEVEADMALGVKVNLLGMVNLFEAAARHKLARLVFTSSETVFGASQKVYGDRPVVEDDYCRPHDHFFTYGVMKILDEFMAQKYVAKHGVSIVCTRPAVVFGHGRKRGSVLWAEAFATQPALGRTARLPFSRHSRDTWIYKDDCAEQLVRLALKRSLSHFAYNNGGASVTAEELAAAVRHWLPEAQFEFDETTPRTPLIDWQDGTRLEGEIGFRPRPLLDGVRAHINEARTEAGLEPV